MPMTFVAGFVDTADVSMYSIDGDGIKQMVTTYSSSPFVIEDGNESGSSCLLRMASEMTNEANPRSEASTTRWTPVGWLKQLFTGGTSPALFTFFDCSQCSLFLD